LNSLEVGYKYMSNHWLEWDKWVLTNWPWQAVV